MPIRPLRHCRHPRCATPTSVDYCPDHQLHRERLYRGERGTRQQLGYGAWWMEARKHYLREHPLCVDCYRRGEVVPATEVDHVVPHHGDQKLFRDRRNWQALCKPCHSRKTMNEMRGITQACGEAEVKSITRTCGEAEAKSITRGIGGSNRCTNDRSETPPGLFSPASKSEMAGTGER